MIPEITWRYWSVNIRKFVMRAGTLDELVALGTLTRQAALFLEAAVVAGPNVIVAGGTQAGKTTLLTNTLGTGIKLAEDPSVTSASRSVILVDELRANISWAGTVGVVLTTLLVLTGAFAGDDRDPASQDGHNQYLSGLVLAIFLHLMLTLLMILKRVRSTYSLLAK